jgi:signal transduction histidine kinase
VLGSLADADARRRRDLGDHRAAIEAQVLEAQAIERDRIAETLAMLGERQGDARRLLAAALAEVDRVDAGVDALSAGCERSEAAALARGLRAGLERLRHAVADSVPHGGGHGPAVALEAVDAARVAREVAAEAARRFLGVAISGPAPGAAPVPPALVGGGAESLQLILEHLVENACQGDGVTGARAVEIAVSAGTACVDVVVSDDGPGLRADLLASPVRPFVTTKHEGTGLGLYTASRLAAASGGELLRENPAGGGARLTLRLPASEPSST